MFVNNFANLFDALLKDTMCRGISDHQTCQVLSVFFSFSLEIVDINLSVFVGFHNNDLHASKSSRSRVSSVSRFWNKASLSVSLIDTNQIISDDSQASVFSLRSRVGLK
jgi:hypothetical protein